jgi:hypothetical protein
MIVKSVAYVRDPLPIGVVTHADLQRSAGKRQQLTHTSSRAGDVGSFRVFRWRFVAGYSAAGQSVVGTDGG